ncbi:MAG: hypothetical protein HY376_03935 [Candidatus Blackburnbacteria bacterium]|nr:hypothetical protein [Candidatus Blackburnbacteria bacterium]
MSQENKKRNRALYRDFKKGASIRSLGKKYEISYGVVHRIVKRERERGAVEK